MTYSPLTAPKRPQAEIRASRPSPQTGSGDTLLKAVVATIAGAARRREDAAETLYPGDARVKMLQKAAVSPATLSSSEWAGTLASTAVADYIGGLTSFSAAAQLIAASLQIELGRSSGVRIPGVVNNSPLAGFVAEGEPIPVQRFTVEAPTLKPAKLAAIVAFTRETARSTGFEAICRQVLAENVGLGLDAALLSDAAETTASPAGLRAGATSVTATAGGGEDAFAGDVVNLAAAVTGVAGRNIVFVASPDEWIKIMLRPREFAFPVLPSAALPTGTLMAVAVNALAVAFDPVPEFEVASEGLLHMDDAPSHIGTETGVAAPAQSLFQTDALGLRLILGASWALRAPAASSVAVAEAVTW